jgi:hypothetical protein
MTRPQLKVAVELDEGRTWSPGTLEVGPGSITLQVLGRPGLLRIRASESRGVLATLRRWFVLVGRGTMECAPEDVRCDTGNRLVISPHHPVDEDITVRLKAADVALADILAAWCPVE